MSEIKDIDFTAEIQFKAVEIIYSSLSAPVNAVGNNRSEERRVGKEC